MKIWADRHIQKHEAGVMGQHARDVEPFINPYFVLPIGIGVGIWLYFALSFEPSFGFFALAVLFCLGVGLVFYCTQQLNYRYVRFVLFICLGFAACQFKTYTDAHDILPNQNKSYNLKAELIGVNDGYGGRRHYTLRPIELGAFDEPAKIGLIRLTTSGQSHEPDIGSFLCTKAMLRGPRHAVAPGYYNAARSFYFKKIGAIGYNVKAIKLCEKPPLVKSAKLSHWFGRLRHSIRNDISLHLTGDHSAFTKAIIVGDKAGLSAGTYADIRFVGLAHLLAISGLHMGLFVGSVFWSLRFLFCLSPYLALHYPIKKWAAIGALLSGYVYLNIAGLSVSTQRAFVMASIMMIAILFNRPALSFSNIALAASFILLTQPEQLLTPGFQMSFAASIGLIALYNRLSTIHQENQHQGDKRFGKLKAILASSVIGSLVTAPFAMYHFNQVSYLGLLTNVIAIPFFSIFIMPLCVLYLVTIPLGLSGFVLPILSWFETSFLNFVRFTANLDFPLIEVSTPTRFMVIFIGLSMFLLWKWIWFKKRLLFLCLALAFGLSPVLLQQIRIYPDIYISGGNKVFALKDGNGRLQAPQGRKGSYPLGLWLKHVGDHRSSKEIRNNAFIHCDKTGCTAKLDHYQFYQISHYLRLEQICQQKHSPKVLLLGPYIEPTKKCLENKTIKAIISNRDLRDKGAHVLYAPKDNLIIETVSNVEGMRPWSMQAKQKQKRERD